MTRPSLARVPLWLRFFALVVVLVTLVVANAGQARNFNTRLEDEQIRLGELRRAELLAEQLVVTAVTEQSAMLGFALTSDEALLENYSDSRRAQAGYIGSLRRQLADRPELLGQVNRVQAAKLAWRRQAAEPAIAATRAGRTQEATRLVARFGEPLFETARADAEVLRQTLEARLDTAVQRVAGAREDLSRALLVTSALSILILFVSVVLLRRWMTHPFAALSEQVRRVAAGQLRQEIMGTGPPEFRALGRDVELMRGRILDELEQAHRSAEALEQNAPLVESLRKQLGPTIGTDLPAGLRIEGRLEPASGVLAGDWFDVIGFDDQRAALIMVDVSGHGPEAGLRALWLKHLLVPALQMGLEPGHALSWVAGEMGDTGEWFATCVVIEIDASTGACSYANAGHPPALMLDGEGVVELPATGPLFGPLLGQRWATEEVSLGEDQMLVVYTDGITESRNAMGEEFGNDRLVSCFLSSAGLDPASVADRVMSQVHEFGSERLKDDATLAVACRSSRPGSEPDRS